MDIVRVQVGQLGLCDLLELLFGKRADLVRLRNRRTGLEVQRLFDQDCRRRGLADEVESLVFVDRDLDRDDGVALVLRGGIECLAELHDVDALGAEGGAYWRSRVSLTSRDLQLDKAYDLFILLSHCCSLLYTRYLLMLYMKSTKPREKPSST